MSGKINQTKTHFLSRFKILGTIIANPPQKYFRPLAEVAIFPRLASNYEICNYFENKLNTHQLHQCF